MGVETKGFKELLNDLDRMLKKTESRQVASEALRAGCQVILNQMKHNASTDPKERTGDLKNALDLSGANLSGKQKYMTVGVHRKDWKKRAHKPESGENHYYPAYVEFGHEGPAPAPPHPYIRIAFDKRHEEAYAEMRRVLEDALK